MQSFIESPGTSSQRPGSRRLLAGAAILVVLFIVIREGLAGWVDLLWFDSLGYGQVFWKTLGLQWGVFASFALVTFAVLYAVCVALQRLHEADLPAEHAIVLGGQRMSISVGPALRALSLAVSVLAGLLAGASMMAEWPTLALLWYAPHGTGGAADPIFGKAVSFFLFTLPAWQVINAWLMTLAVASVAWRSRFLSSQAARAPWKTGDSGTPPRHGRAFR